MNFKKTLLFLILPILLLLCSCGTSANIFYYDIIDEEAYLFRVTTTLDEFTIEEEFNGYDVVGIKEGTFFCTLMYYMNFSTNLKYIENNAFRGCEYLLEIRIPSDSNLEKIEEFAFTNCLELTSIELYNCNNLTTIGKGAFKDCSSLKEIYIPSSVVYIGANAFKNCSNLVINLETNEIPSSFDENWNIDNCKVNLGKKYINE